MVHMEIWNDEYELKLESRQVISFEDALEFLKRFENQVVDVRKLWGSGASHNIQIFADKVYLFRFTDKQLKSINDYLKELNGGLLQEVYCR